MEFYVWARLILGHDDWFTHASIQVEFVLEANLFVPLIIGGYRAYMATVVSWCWLTIFSSIAPLDNSERKLTCVTLYKIELLTF